MITRLDVGGVHSSDYRSELMICARHEVREHVGGWERQERNRGGHRGGQPRYDLGSTSLRALRNQPCSVASCRVSLIVRAAWSKGIKRRNWASAGFAIDEPFQSPVSFVVQSGSLNLRASSNVIEA